MKTTGIANLKAHLSEILAEVKGGEEILVTDRGNPVARLTAVEPAVGGTGSNNSQPIVKLIGYKFG